MHGVKRTRISPQAAEAKRQKEQAKIVSYSQLQEDVLARKEAQDYSSAALKATNDLLDLNPEFYTIWNYRRHILSNGLFPTASPEEVVALLSAELRLTTAYLHVHPKVYWIWNHRKWCLEHVPAGPPPPPPTESASPEGQAQHSDGWRNDFWKVELRMLEAMLGADARNFHAWDYRRYVLRSLPPSFSPPRTAADELRYTQKKIEASFSNFSAWHLRTKLLGEMWAAGARDDSTSEAAGANVLTRAQVAESKDKEFELVTQALWTDPADQSGWLYHRWLVGADPDESVLRRELKNVRELHETEPDSKWCMNALAHYALLLARRTETDEATRLKDEARALYARLEAVDEDRKGRYQDMARSI